MAIRRDSVNRKFNLVKVPVHAGPNVHVGDVVDLVDVDEQEITPDIRDPMAGFGQPDGSNYGDAIFDAKGGDPIIFDPMPAES